MIVVLAGFWVPASATARAAAAGPTNARYERGPRAMVDIHGRLFLVAGNTLVVMTPAGNLIRRVTGIKVAISIAVNAAQTRVYVSSLRSNRIYAIDTETYRVRATYRTRTAPAQLAISGHYLFYGYGQSPYGVGALNLATGRAEPDLFRAGTITVSPFLLVTNGRLLVGHQDELPSVLESYRLTGPSIDKATVTSMPVDNLLDIEKSPDGKHIVIADGGVYTLNEYNPVTLALQKTFSSGAYTTAAAWSPDGSEVAAGGFDNNPVTVFDATTGAARTLNHLVGATSSHWRTERSTLVFDPSGQHIFGFGTEVTNQADEPGHYFSLSTGTRKHTTLTMTTRITKTSHVLTATATLGRAGRPVEFAVTIGGVVHWYARTTTAAGVATLTVHETLTGKIKALYEGDTVFGAAATASKTFAIKR